MGQDNWSIDGDDGQPQDVWARMLKRLPEGAILTAAIVVIEYQTFEVVDGEQPGKWLYTGRDKESTAWSKLGMMEWATAQARATVANGGDD